jgi:hypothetical protein
MKKIKVLILAYDFPPLISVGGIRPSFWMKNFKEFDVYPIVVTRQWSNDDNLSNVIKYVTKSESKNVLVNKTDDYTLIQAPFSSNFSNKLLLRFGEKRFKKIRQINTAIIEYLQFFIPYGNKRTILNAADEYLKMNSVDLIIATGEPFVLFHFANILSKKHKIPWIADYRDLWSQNRVAEYSDFRRKIYSFLESRIIKNSTLITTVSSHLKHEINKIAPLVPIEIIANGYDLDITKKTQIITQESKILSFVFVGSIYYWNPWREVIDVFANLLDSDEKIEMNIYFYGTNIDKEIADYVENYSEKVTKSIKIHPKLPNNILLEKLAKKNVMLLFNYYTFMGTKIFDYLGVKRKILLCFEEFQSKETQKEFSQIFGESDNYSLQSDLINATNSGIIVKNKINLVEILKELHKEFKETGQIACNSIHTEKYSRDKQLEKLAELLRKIVENKKED